MANSIIIDSLFENEIPKIDYSILFSDDHDQRAKALKNLNKVCQEFGFFYLVNHGVPEKVIEEALKKTSEYFVLTEEEERRKYNKRNAMDNIRRGFQSHDGENRECLKVFSHPEYHTPQTSLPDFRETLEEYFKSCRKMVLGLAKAISNALGLDACYIERTFKLESGFDVSAMNFYPPCFKSKSSYGLPEHTDPGFVITLIQDVNGGLEVLNNDKWYPVNMPQNSILIQLGDHLEILTNGKYKSHIHRVMVGNNRVERISIATLHGPALESVVVPSPKLLSQGRPPMYQEMTYKESLLASGNDQIDVQSNIEKIRHG